MERLRHIVLEVIQEVIAGRSHTSSGDVDVSTDASMQGMEGACGACSKRWELHDTSWRFT